MSKQKFEPQFSSADDSLLLLIDQIDLEKLGTNHTPHFTSNGKMNQRMWAAYPATQPPYHYAKKQNKGRGIEFYPTNSTNTFEFEPASNFDCNKLDLP